MWVCNVVVASVETFAMDAQAESDRHPATSARVVQRRRLSREEPMCPEVITHPQWVVARVLLEDDDQAFRTPVVHGFEIEPVPAGADPGPRARRASAAPAIAMDRRERPAIA